MAIREINDVSVVIVRGFLFPVSIERVQSIGGPRGVVVGSVVSRTKKCV